MKKLVAEACRGLQWAARGDERHGCGERREMTIAPSRATSYVGTSVHHPTAKLERLNAARLDATDEDEKRKLHRVDLLVLDDLALHRLEATETQRLLRADRRTPPQSLHDHHFEPGSHRRS